MPLYPRKRTWIGTLAMSVLCQKRTLAHHLFDQRQWIFESALFANTIIFFGFTGVAL
jgi:hypothetical protein